MTQSKQNKLSVSYQQCVIVVLKFFLYVYLDKHIIYQMIVKSSSELSFKDFFCIIKWNSLQKLVKIMNIRHGQI
jgi:hypothetical protein